MISKIKFAVVLFPLLILYSCEKNYTPEEKLYIEKVNQFRDSKNQDFKNSPDSPFNFKNKIQFKNLNYFDVDPSFVFKSRLYEFSNKDTITIFGTKGESRTAVKFGFVKFRRNDGDYKINVYKSYSKSGEEYFGIWFTDQTTNHETYGVGRYLDFEKNENKDYVYTIDFNFAYNPYCAYSPVFSCAIPTKDDYIDLAISAGEKKFH